MAVALEREDGKDLALAASSWGHIQGDHGFGPSPIRNVEDLVILANDQSGPSLTVSHWIAGPV